MIPEVPVLYWDHSGADYEKGSIYHDIVVDSMRTFRMCKDGNKEYILCAGIES